jgi:molybdate transport system regulatory protein
MPDPKPSRDAQKTGHSGLAGQTGPVAPGKVFSIPSDIKYLDSLQIEALTAAFQRWRQQGAGTKRRTSRDRVWFIYLLLRYTGARLGEILNLDDRTDIDLERGVVKVGQGEGGTVREGREVQLPEAVLKELRPFLEKIENQGLRGLLFQVDPGFVRRKFYERAQEAALPKDLANPTVLRKSRAIELLRNDVPLTVVQSVLGHSTSNLTASYLDYSDDDIHKIIGQFIRKETRRRTSARNSFYGKITGIKRGEVQSQVELTTLSGIQVYSIITTDSLETLELSKDRMATAIVKAPWVVVSKEEHAPRTTARNKFRGRVVKLNTGSITSEVVVELPDATLICAIVTQESVEDLGLSVGDRAWVMFKALSVIVDLD